MKTFSTFVTFLFFSLALASPLSRRDASTVESDLTAITDDLTIVTSAVNAFTGTTIQAAALVIKINNLKNDIVTATADVEDTDTLSTSDSTTVTNSLATLTSEYISFLTDLDIKESDVDSSGYVTAVYNALSTLRADTDDLYAAVKAIVSSSNTSTITALKVELDAAFIIAQNAFE